MTAPQPSPAFYDALRARVGSIKQARSDRALWRLAQEFEESLLYQEQLPSSAFDFLVYLFTTPEVMGHRGLMHFVVVLGSEFHKLTEPQKTTLLEVLLEHHHQYADELTRHSIGDLIARHYPPSVAFKSLRTLRSAAGDRAKHLAFVLADVLARRLKEPDPLRAEVLEFLRQSSDSG